MLFFLTNIEVFNLFSHAFVTAIVQFTATHLTFTTILFFSELDFFLIMIPPMFSVTCFGFILQGYFKIEYTYVGF